MCITFLVVDWSTTGKWWILLKWQEEDGKAVGREASQTGWEGCWKQEKTGRSFCSTRGLSSHNLIRAYLLGSPYVHFLLNTVCLHFCRNQKHITKMCPTWIKMMSLPWHRHWRYFHDAFNLYCTLLCLDFDSWIANDYDAFVLVLLQRKAKEFRKQKSIDKIDAEEFIAGPSKPSKKKSKSSR